MQEVSVPPESLLLHGFTLDEVQCLAPSRVAEVYVQGRTVPALVKDKGY